MQVFEAETTVEQWDSDYYTPISVKLYDRAVADMIAGMAPPPGAEVLDAGCGPGVHSIRVAKLGYRVHAIDISATMLEHARARVKAAGFAERVRFDQMDLTKLDLADSSVQYAFSWGVIIHIPDAMAAFRELSRIMKPGGRLGLYLTNRSALDHKIERLARAVLNKPLTYSHSPLGTGVRYQMPGGELWVWQFDAAGLTKALADLGFKRLLRRCGEFSEFQRRTSDPLRSLLLRGNNAAQKLHAPATLASTNLWVFERQ